MKKNTKKFFSSHSTKSYLIAGVLSIVVLGIVVTYFVVVKGQDQTIPSTITSTSPNQKSEDNSSDNTSEGSSQNTDQSSDSDKSQTGDTSGGSNAVLKDPPTGAFVSNHRPSLSGSSAPSHEQSACNTLTGATCYIQFTKNGVTKSLETKIADQNGVVIWNWDVKTAGLDEGEWTITATATLGGQTKSSMDSLKLIVGP